MDLIKVANLYYDLLVELGYDPDDPDLRRTPERCAAAWSEFIDYDPGNTDVTFETVNTNALVAVSGIEVWSMCEHHLLPFHAVVSIAMIPRAGQVLGLSKFARIAHQFACRLQNQERLTAEIAGEVIDLSKSPDVAVVIQGSHLCAVMRGIKSPMTMHTAEMRGLFETDHALRAEFYQLIKPGLAWTK